MHEHIVDLGRALRWLHANGPIDQAVRLVGAIADVTADEVSVATGRTLLDVGDEIGADAPWAAFHCLSAARMVFMIEGIPHGMGACDVIAAQLTAGGGQLQRAAELYNHGLELVDVEVDAGMVGRGWHNYAILLRTLDEPEESIDAEQTALSAYRRAGLATPTADCHVGIGIALHHLGRPEDALEPFAAGRALYVEFGEDALLADVDDRRGLALCDLGRFTESIEAHTAAVVRYESIGDAWSAARCRRYRAHPLDHAGQLDEALDDLHAAREVFAEVDDEVEVARCDAASGAAFLALGQHAAARPLLDGARHTLETYDLEGEAHWCARLLVDPNELAHSHPE